MEKIQYFSFYFNDDNGKKFGDLFSKQILNKWMILAIYFALAVTLQNTLASQIDSFCRLHIEWMWSVVVCCFFFLVCCSHSFPSLLSFHLYCCVQLLYFECLQWNTPNYNSRWLKHCCSWNTRTSEHINRHTIAQQPRKRTKPMYSVCVWRDIRILTFLLWQASIF